MNYKIQIVVLFSCLSFWVSLAKNPTPKPGQPSSKIKKIKVFKIFFSLITAVLILKLFCRMRERVHPRRGNPNSILQL